MSDVVLEVRGLARAYGSVQAVRDVSFEIRQGETLTLLGPSGCGKSTTLRAIAGLEPIDAGEIRMRDKLIASAAKRISLPPEKRNVGLVFQSYAIWPHMTVAQNVAYPLRARRVARPDSRRRVAETLELVGLEEYADRPASNLSGGQQQRVALARALVYEPDLILLDEPLSNLDATRRQAVRVYLKDLQRRLGITVLFVTHDQVEAMTLSHHLAVMNEGVIEQIGTPRDVYLTPATPFVHQFVGSSLSFRGSTVAHNGRVGVDIGGAILPLADGAPPAGSAVIASVRPEEIVVDWTPNRPAADTVLGHVEQVSFLGDRLECAIRLGEHRIFLNATPAATIEVGDAVGLRFPPGRIRTWPA